MLILAGVTIALLNGENGILSRTEKAVTNYKIESIKEVVNLKLANLNASKWIDERRKAVLKDLNEFDDSNSQNFDAEIALKNLVTDADTSAILIYDKHEIEIDSSFNIAKVDGVDNMGTTGGTSGGSSSGESGSGSNTNAGVIDSQEYQQMQATIAQLQQKVNQLEAENAKLDEKYANKSIETEIASANSKIDSAQNQIDNMLTTLDVDTRTTLFEGTAETAGQTYPISNIADYKYLIVYVDCCGNNIRGNRTSMLINVNDIVYNNSTNETSDSIFNISSVGYIGNSSYYYAIQFCFKDSTSFFINSSHCSNWWSQRIYKIEGIK